MYAAAGAAAGAGGGTAGGGSGATGGGAVPSGRGRGAPGGGRGAPAGGGSVATRRGLGVALLRCTAGCAGGEAGAGSHCAPPRDSATRCRTIPAAARGAPTTVRRSTHRGTGWGSWERIGRTHAEGGW
jgi:hypothetical protein